MTQSAPSVPSGPVSNTVLLVGNPNVGKTTLFNGLTGQQARVGNYPGVTVERRSALVELGDRHVELVDVPGAYSLSARSAEEQVAIEAALGICGNPTPTLIVVVIDAGQLARNLYFALQLAEFRLPVLLVLTMMDEVAAHPPIPERVGALFGVPCVGVNARRKDGLHELRATIAAALRSPPVADVDLPYGETIRRCADRVAETLPAEWRRNVEHDRALALWALLSLEDDDELTAPDELRRKVNEVRGQADASDIDLDLSIIETRYDALERRLSSCYESTSAQSERTDWTERVDRYLLHPVYGFAFFVLTMLAVFQALFAWADPAIGVIEDGVTYLQDLVSTQLPEGLFTDLLVEGVLGGVGNVIVFLPQILLLFFLVGLLEDSGYMARVAYLMDRVLRSVGLHGKAFVPMMSGMACAVPAILATRTMERRRDRLLTMMVVPLMTCSARLPVYTLVIGALFPPSHVFGFVPVQGLLMVSMYLFGIVITLLAAWVLGRTVVRGRSVPLILELPRYRMPSWGTTTRMMLQRAGDFLREAGTVILGFTILLWALLSFPKPPDSATTTPEAPTTQVVATSDSVTIGASPAARAVSGAEPTRPSAAPSDGDASLPEQGAASVGVESMAEHAPAIEFSLGGRLGKALEPLMRPLGFDWKITVGLIGAFSAREVFVSTMGLVFGLEDADDEAAPLRDKMRAETRADGRPAYPPLVGLSLMVFFALACQCMSTVAVVRRETKSWRWPALLVVYMTLLAYVASLLVYQGGKLLGLGV